MDPDSDTIVGDLDGGANGMKCEWNEQGRRRRQMTLDPEVKTKMRAVFSVFL